MTRRRATTRKQRGESALAKASPGTRDDRRDRSLEKILQIKREEVERGINDLLGGNLTEETRHKLDVVLDVGDQSILSHETDLDLTLLEMKGRALKEIDAAFGRLKEERYGICEECGEKINLARLNVMPFAGFCVACQGRKEMLEKIEKGRAEK